MSVSKWRKRPVVIDAILFDGSNATDIANWITGAGGGVVVWGEHYLDIPTLEGRMRALVGDWVIRGVHGEHYPCKPDIFAATYEPVGG